MFVIFGISRVRHPVNAYRMVCGKCNRDTILIAALEKKAFSLFWIPLIPLGSSKLLKCMRCGAEVTIKIFSASGAVPPKEIYPTLRSIMDSESVQV